MLDHLSHAFFSFPIFGFVGMRDRLVAPTAVRDIVRILKASIETGTLSRKTVAVIGPEQLGLRDAVRRVAAVVGRRPLFVPLPLWVHAVLARIFERVMKVPVVARAQLRILAEGVVEAWGVCDPLPSELIPTARFSDDEIRRGLPSPGGFTLADMRCPCSAR